MSLKEAVMEIADAMEKDTNGNVPLPKQAISAYVMMLRMACKAANDPVPAAQTVSPMAQHSVEIEKAKAEFRQKRLQAEEQIAEKMAEVASGPEKGTTVPIGDMPVGAKTKIGKDVYSLRQDGRLYHEALLT